MEFPKQEYWSGLPFPTPGDLPNPGIELASFASLHEQADSLLLTTWEAPFPICKMILWHLAFFIVQLSHPYMTAGKTIALTIRTFVGNVSAL